MKRTLLFIYLLLTSTMLFSQELIVSVSANEISCFGEPGGEIIVDVTGGVSPYTYSLLDSSGMVLSGPIEESTSTFLFVNLWAGLYTVQVEDAVGAVIGSESFITQPDEPLSSEVFLISGTTIEVDANGGTLPYEYSLDEVTFQSSNIFSNLPTGNYNVITRDVNGCMDISETVTIAETLELSVTETNLIYCYGDCSGAVLFDVTGGLSPYTYSLLDSSGMVLSGPIETSDSTFSFENLCAGLYSGFVEDVNGLTSIVDVTIEEPLELSASATINLPTGNVASGLIEIDILGGSAPYLFSIDGNDYQALNIFTGLSSGSHLIEVQDVSGCILQSSVDTGSIDVDNTVTVDGFTLTATLEADSYQWYNADTNTMISGATDQVYVATEPGNYYVIMTIDDITRRNDVVTVASPVYEVTGALSVNDVDLQIAQVYPNPTDNFLIFPETSINESYSIYNVLGSKVASGTVDNTEVSVRNLIEGIYFLSITNHNTTKFIKR